MSNSIRPGQCDIESISITDNTRSKTLSLSEGTDKFKKFTDYIHSIDIYESVERPYIICDVVLVDGSSLFEDFNFSGGEDFKINFKGFGDTESLSYTFKVAETTFIKPMENMRSKHIGLRLTSAEYLTASAEIVSKSYEGGADTVLKDIFANFLQSKKPLKIEGTKFQPKVIIPFLDPFRAIDMVRTRVVSTENQTHNFLFFENQKGFFFKSAEALIKNENSDMAVQTQTFFQKQSISSKVKGTESEVTDTDSHKLFANYTVTMPSDLAHLLKDGGYKNNVTEFDLVKKKYTTRLFENKPPGQNPLLTNKIKSDYSYIETRPYLIPYATYKDVNNKTINFLFDSIPERVAFSNIFNQQTTFIDIPGNTKVMAGCVINLKVPNYDSVGNEDLNNVVSGKYLVTAVRHSLNIYTDSKYSTHLELKRIERGATTK